MDNVESNKKLHLIIIGNGFDLAHRLKTSYSSFLESLIKEEIKAFKEKIVRGQLFNGNSKLFLLRFNVPNYPKNKDFVVNARPDILENELSIIPVLSNL